MKKAIFITAALFFFSSSIVGLTYAAQKVIMLAPKITKAAQAPAEGKALYWSRNLHILPEFNSLTIDIASAAETRDGGIVAVANVYEEGARIVPTWKPHEMVRIMAVKYGADGNLEWKKAFAEKDFIAGQYVDIYGDRAYFIRQTSDGGYIIAGEAQHPTVDDYSAILVVKLDAAGKLQWKKTYKSSAEDAATYVEEVADGFLVLGHGKKTHPTSSPSPNYDIVALKIGNDGHFISNRTFGDPILDDVLVSATGKANKLTLLIQKLDHGPNDKAFSIVTVDSSGRIDRSAKYDFNKLKLVPSTQNPLSVADLRIVKISAVDEGFLILADTNHNLLKNDDFHYNTHTGLILIKLDENLKIESVKHYMKKPYVVEADTAVDFIILQSGDPVVAANYNKKPLLIFPGSDASETQAIAYTNARPAKAILKGKNDGFFIVLQDQILKVDQSGKVGRVCDAFKIENWTISASDISVENIPSAPFKFGSNDSDDLPFEEKNASLPNEISDFTFSNESQCME